MKRLMCMLLVMTMLLSGAALAEEERNATMDAVAEDWLNFIYIQEIRIAQENRALEQVARFAQTRTWEDLVRARTATAFAGDVVSGYANYPFTPTSTKEDFAALEAQGIDIWDAWYEFQNYELNTRYELSEDVPYWKELYLAELHVGIFNPYVTEDIALQTEVDLKQNSCLLKLLYLQTNYITAELPQVYVELIWNKVITLMPGIASSYDKPFPEANDALVEMEYVLDEMMWLAIESERVLTSMKVTLETIDFSLMMAVEGMPQVVPAPKGLDDLDGGVQSYYYWISDEGEVIAPSLDMTLDELPNKIVYVIPAENIGDFHRYAIELIDAGFQPDEMTDTARSFSFDNGSTLLIRYDDDQLTVSIIGGQLSLVPMNYYNQLTQAAE